MEYVLLGNSDLRVSRICLGCMGFGDPTIGQHSWTVGEEPTREIIRRSLDLGVNFFDTAIAYQLGTSEQYVGRALFPMQSAEAPTQIRILEIYASQDAYQQHLATEHFQKYKQGTLHMVKSLSLPTMQPLDAAMMKQIFRKQL